MIERYRRRESSVESLDRDEMYLAGFQSSPAGGGHHRSTVGHPGQPRTVSNLNKTISAKIEVWRNRPIEGEHPDEQIEKVS
jgi:hypothetical protein